MTYKKNSGTSLLELMIALLITAIIINSAYQLYRYTTKSASREKEKAELQNEIINACNIMEKDIRMAGCSIPGNGINATSAPNETLFIFTNRERFKTKLASIAQPGHDRIVVVSDSGFLCGKWIFIPFGSSFVKRQIVAVKTNPAGNDTIVLDLTIGVGPISVGTDVFPADRIIYTIYKTSSGSKLLKIKNNQTFTIGKKIDSLRIVPRNMKGNIVSLSNIDSVA
ncbi:MAG: hypothetical protein N2053_05970, partial [Chitinispirillaceae bacterium]|nr:hypothetical protein [Chitinispirillaceae bacterium]